MKQQITAKRVGNDLGIRAPKVFFYVIGNGDDLIVEIQLLKGKRPANPY
jgi:hypothetical protein